MADDFDGAKDLYKWNRTVFAVLGVWPLQSTYITFTLWIAYIAFHLSMEYSDLYHVFGNLELMIQNFSESTLETMILVKLLMLRFSRTLVCLMIRIIDGVDARHFESPEEKRIYLNYNRIAKYFFRLWLIMGSVASIMYHIKPLEFRLRAALSNESLPFVLPYRTRLFFDVDDSSTFWMVWTFQMPMVYVHMFHSVTIGFLFSLVLHVCGQLSVLAHRIRNIEVGPSDNPQHSKIIFRDIVERHRHIISLARDIDKVFHVILLEELIVSTVIVGLTSYSVLVNSDLSDKAVFVSFLLYGATMLLLIYGYCVAGEYLINESANVYDAYYQCQWQDVSNSFKKQLIICMIGASKPLRLTGGGYYVFSLVNFTGVSTENVLKTAGSYISMLRKVVAN